MAGRNGVGKSALLTRLAFDSFSDKASEGLGIRIERIEAENSGKKINMVFWDLAGDTNDEDTPLSYFLGANALIYVVDINDKESYLALSEDLAGLKEKIADTPILIVANKEDLLQRAQIDKVLAQFPEQPNLICSAKTGSGCDSLFERALSLSLTND